jgi:hypothetical protein
MFRILFPENFPKFQIDHPIEKRNSRHSFAGAVKGFTFRHKYVSADFS